MDTVEQRPIALVRYVGGVTTGIVTTDAVNGTGDQSEKGMAVGAANFTQAFRLHGPRMMIYLKWVKGGATDITLAMVLFGADGSLQATPYRNIGAGQQFVTAPSYTGTGPPQSYMLGTSYTLCEGNSLAAGAPIAWQWGPITTASGNYCAQVDLSAATAGTAGGFGGGSAIPSQFGRLLVTPTGANLTTTTITIDVGFAH